MTWTGASAVAMAAALLAAAPVRAAACTKDADCSAGNKCQSGKCVSKTNRSGTAATSDAGSSGNASPAASPATVTSGDASPTAVVGTRNAPRFGWGQIGIYTLGVSIDTGFGTVSGSSSYFGLEGGAAMNLASLGADVPLAGFASVGLGLGSGGVFIPLTLGAAVRYDRLPVGLMGGAGFILMPITGGGPTTLGVNILALAHYPLPSVNPNMSVLGKFSYAILSDHYSLWTLTAGLGYAF